MQFFITKYENIKDFLIKKDLYEPRLLGLLLIAFVGLAVVWNGVKVIQTNYDLLQKIAVLEEENAILELENENKKIQIEYYKTPEFAELKARQVNGKAAPGETVYIVTEDTAMNALKTPEQQEEIQIEVDEKPEYQKNFEAWIDFFFGDKG